MKTTKKLKITIFYKNFMYHNVASKEHNVQICLQSTLLKLSQIWMNMNMVYKLCHYKIQKCTSIKHQTMYTEPKTVSPNLSNTYSFCIQHIHKYMKHLFILFLFHSPFLFHALLCCCSLKWKWCFEPNNHIKLSRSFKTKQQV